MHNLLLDLHGTKRFARKMALFLVASIYYWTIYSINKHGAVRCAPDLYAIVFRTRLNLEVAVCAIFFCSQIQMAKSRLIDGLNLAVEPAYLFIN